MSPEIFGWKKGEKDRAVKLNLVINEIAENENISVSEEEFAEEIAISSIGMGFNNADECIAIFGKDDIKFRWHTYLSMIL